LKEDFEDPAWPVSDAVGLLTGEIASICRVLVTRWNGKEQTMQTGTKTGTFKRPEPDVIASVVKELRTHLGWKQFALAHEAGVTVRTIERLEAGERMSDETLNKVAKALELRESAFTEASYCPSDEELAGMVKKAKKDYTHTALHDLSGLRDLDNILSAQAYLVDGSNVADDLADQVAAVQDYVQDAGDIHGDVPHTHQLTHSRELLGMIRDIEVQGYTARWGRYVTDDKFNVGVLTFFKTCDLQTSQQFRIALVPRSLVHSLAD
jgi:transcriptional regulator with XRE-family HTH domain